MDNIKDDYHYAKKIRDDFQFVLDQTQGLSKQAITGNEVLLDSIMFRLIQISENSLKLTESFKNQFMSIPWLALKGLRNRIVHDYGNVDYSVIYTTIKDEIPACVAELNQIFGS